MKSFLSNITEDLSIVIAEWIDSEVDKLVPKWLQKLAMIDKTGLVVKMLGIEIKYSTLVGNFGVRYGIFQHGECKAHADFGVNIKMDHSDGVMKL